MKKKIKCICMIFALSILPSFSQDELYDKIENALIDIHFGHNLDSAMLVFPILEKECMSINNDTIINCLNSLKASLTFYSENYSKATPILEEEIKWKESHGLTRYHYLEDILMLAQCYLINDSIGAAEKCLRRAIVNWTDESGISTIVESTGTIQNYPAESKLLLLFSGFYITDIFQTLAIAYEQQGKTTLVPHCYKRAQMYATALYNKDDDRYYENLILLIQSYIDLGKYSRAKSYLINYQDIPNELESHEEMKALQEELESHH